MNKFLNNLKKYFDDEIKAYIIYMLTVFIYSLVPLILEDVNHWLIYFLGLIFGFMTLFSSWEIIKNYLKKYYFREMNQKYEVQRTMSIQLLFIGIQAAIIGGVVMEHLEILRDNKIIDEKYFVSLKTRYEEDSEKFKDSFFNTGAENEQVSKQP